MRELATVAMSLQVALSPLAIFHGLQTLVLRIVHDRPFNRERCLIGMASQAVAFLESPDRLFPLAEWLRVQKIFRMRSIEYLSRLTLRLGQQQAFQTLEHQEAQDGSCQETLFNG